MYERCLIHECRIANLDVQSQIKIPLNYKGINLDAELRLDLLINDLIVVEIKAVETFHPVYEAQILSYMRLLEMPKGILLNFCSNNIFKDGQKTFVNMHFSNLPDE